MKAPLPPNEADRLMTLRGYNILDTPSEPPFDDLVALAARICDVPTAMVSFVDADRQWFKSQIGMPLLETTRDISFCAHSLLQPDEVLQIYDAREDARFRDNPLVTAEPYIRFYAGAPLIAPGGQPLGALCVMDHSPRTLTSGQREALRTLSRHVVRQLEFRRQAHELAKEVTERQVAEGALRKRYEQLAESERAASELLSVAEQSRQALLRVLEDEKFSAQRLRESETRFRQLTENINEVFWMSDPDKRTILYVSPAYEVIWGRSCESLYAEPHHWAAAIHPDDRARVLAASYLQAKGNYNEIYRILRPDGSMRWISDRAFPVKNELGQVYRLVGTAEDITARKRAETITAAEHAIIEALSGGASLPDTARKILEIVCRQLDWELGDLWTVDRSTQTLRCVAIWHGPSGRFQSFAEASQRMRFAAGEGIPGKVWNTRKPKWISEVTEEATFLRRQDAVELELRGALAFPITVRSEVHGVIEFFSKESRPPDAGMVAMFGSLGKQIGQFIERKQLEEQFRQAQKMEAIGTLAGGIAHDFNNVLAAISGYTELAKLESANNPEVMHYLQAVAEGSGRATELVRQILTFSRLQDQQRKPIQLWLVVDEAIKLLRATIPATIAFDLSLARRGPTILGDPTQIHQVIMNLATNAAHAMKESTGRLGITLEEFEVDADFLALYPGLHPGRYMRPCVSDTGHGMDTPTLSRIFDPFFTTKAPGEGTGLGLAVVHGIVQNHDGLITVYSQPGGGTRFHLYFPAHVTEVPESLAREHQAPQGQGQWILLVDDEPPIAHMGKKVLERLGYSVDSHTDPATALRAVQTTPGKYALVITDLTMPGMTGTDLAKEIQQVRPDLRIVLTTGYSASLTLERVQAMGIRELLIKPLTIHELAKVVQRVLTEK